MSLCSIFDSHFLTHSLLSDCRHELSNDVNSCIKEKCIFVISTFHQSHLCTSTTTHNLGWNPFPVWNNPALLLLCYSPPVWLKTKRHPSNEKYCYKECDLWHNEISDERECNMKWQTNKQTATKRHQKANFGVFYVLHETNYSRKQLGNFSSRKNFWASKQISFQFHCQPLC